MKNRIIKFIEDSEDYPTMKELLDEFLLYSGSDIHFLRSMLELQNDATILYDEKHDSWLRLRTINPDEFMIL